MAPLGASEPSVSRPPLSVMRAGLSRIGKIRAADAERAARNLEAHAVADPQALADLDAARAGIDHAARLGRSAGWPCGDRRRRSVALCRR